MKLKRLDIGKEQALSCPDTRQRLHTTEVVTMSDDEQPYTEEEREALEAILDDMNFDRGTPKSALSGTDR